MAFSLQQVIYHNLAPAFQPASSTKPLLFNCIAPIAKQRIPFQTGNLRMFRLQQIYCTHVNAVHLCFAAVNVAGELDVRDVRFGQSDFFLQFSVQRSQHIFAAIHMTAQSNAVLALETFVSAQTQRGKDAPIHAHQNDIRNDLLERRGLFCFAAQHGLQITLNRIGNGFVWWIKAVRQHRQNCFVVYSHDKDIAIFLFEFFLSHSSFLQKRFVSSV
nr:MAG TPA: hypothetical protein [Caudoviricetes sp.]